MELNPKKAYHITVEGSIEEISPNDGREFELEEVQKRVEGYIEIVYLNEKQIMIVNEEGKFDKDYNQLATTIAQLNHALWGGDYICGNVVICPSSTLT